MESLGGEHAAASLQQLPAYLGSLRDVLTALARQADHT
jgi:hypothetical protein